MGQTATDKLVSPLVGKAVTTEFDFDARIDTLEAGVPAAEVTYTPANGAHWVNPDPTLVSGALDDLAGRMTTADTALAYTPGDATKWNGGVDPGTLVQGVDQLASRTKTNETSLTALANAAADIVTLTTKANTIAAAQRVPTITIGAEAAEAIDIGITQVDGLGNAVAVTDRIFMEAFTDAYYKTAANIGLFAVADNGSGSIVAVDGTTIRVVCATSAAGALQLRVTDGGASGTTLYWRGTYLGATAVNISAAPFYFQITFTA